MTEPIDLISARERTSGEAFRAGEIAMLTCERCKKSQLPWNLRSFGDKQVCGDCYAATLELATAAINASEAEEGRRCSNCRALNDPRFGSAWCKVTELGDERALICANFVSVQVEAARVQMAGPRVQAIDAWQAVTELLRAGVGQANYDHWFAQIEAVEITDGSLVLAVPDDFTRDWLTERLTGVVAHALASAGYPDLTPEYVVDVVAPRVEHGPSTAEIKARAGFVPHYTFAEFVVGPENRLAQAAASACVEKCGSAYNPLVLYGGAGVGKTHLLHAIGQKVIDSGNCNVIYATSEMFTNELIAAIREGTTQEFRQRYRCVDYLLLDDIQFIAGKEATQEEFFHTFNALQQAGKQIVISCDRPPSELKVLASRLRSRFESGLLAEMRPPDYATRLTIFRAKVVLRNRSVPESVLTALATRAGQNVRELEGALNRVLALADLMGVEPGTDILRTVLGERESKPDGCRPSDVLQAVSVYFRVTASELAGQQRERKISYARQMAMYLLREEASLSLVEIGRQVGGRNHSTVIYGCDRVGEQKDTGRVKSDLHAIRQLIYGTR
jgi:chromosomal replication initiator protein